MRLSLYNEKELGMEENWMRCTHIVRRLSKTAYPKIYLYTARVPWCPERGRSESETQTQTSQRFTSHGLRDI